MTNQTYFIVFRPGSNGVLAEFTTYEEAWKFSEAYFNEGNGVACVETVTRYHHH